MFQESLLDVEVTLEDGSKETRPGVFSVPINAVCKLSADRTISCKIRVVNDMRPTNEDGDTRNHPPALSPRPREVVRGTAFWRRRHPGIPIVYIKQDVDSAFKTAWLRIDDMGRSATDLPEPPHDSVPEIFPARSST